VRLFEFQAKRIFKKEGILIPNGRVATNAVEVGEIAVELGG
jgi:succinyl-CoA synthetase beta subunit